MRSRLLVAVLLVAGGLALLRLLSVRSDPAEPTRPGTPPVEPAALGGVGAQELERPAAWVHRDGDVAGGPAGARSPAVAGGGVAEQPPAPRPAAVVVLAGRAVRVAPGLDAALGRPAAGVSVRVQAGSFLAAREVGAVETDASGRFRFELPDDGERPLDLVLHAGGDEVLGIGYAETRLTAGESERADIELALREHGALEGHAVDLRGAPLAGVEVALGSTTAGGAPPLLQTAAPTDELGRFRVERARPFGFVEARKPGWTLLDQPRADVREDGTWEPLEVVLARAGALRVHVRAPGALGGAPVPGVRVYVRLAPSEAFGMARPSDFGRQHALQGVTDAAGTAVLADVWAGVRLRVSLSLGADRGGAALGDVERVDGARALLAPAGAESHAGPDVGPGERLVLEPGEERELWVELGTGLAVRGLVTDADGAPFPGALVEARPDGGSGRVSSSRAKCDGDGLFALEVLSAEPLERLVVAAIDREPRPGFGFLVGSDSLTAREVLELGGRTSGELEVRLVLAPALSIAGRIEAEGESVAATLHALPAGSTDGPAAAAASAYSRGETFRLAALAPGAYDVLVKPSAPYPAQLVRGVEAGTDDLVVRLAGERAARVAVEVVATEGELDQAVLLVAPLHPRAAARRALEASTPALPRTATYAELGGWPPWRIRLWSGAAGRTDELGRTDAHLAPLRGAADVRELDPGLYWIGAKARFADGSFAPPVGTGLVRVEPGEHALRFELAPGGAVHGRVADAPPDVELCAALARGGRLLPLDTGRDELDGTCELASDGSFSFPLAPAGECELRIGTRAELLSGEARRREPLDVPAGGTATPVVRL